MSGLKLPLISFVASLAIAAAALAGESGDGFERRGIISAAPTLDAIRISAPADVVRMRVEILMPNGAPVFDSSWKEGNVLDWALQDSFGHQVPWGSYRFVSMWADVAGHVAVRGGTVHLQPAQIDLASDDLAVAPSDRIPSMVRLAHSGDTGQIVTTRGDLAFRFGDFLAGKDSELMRLTASGDLEVSGFVHAGRGIVFSDGTILQTAAIPSILRLPHVPAFRPIDAVSGVGTTNRLTKWTDAIGTLGDSAVTETGGKVGIGTDTPGALFHVFGAATSDVFSGLGPNVVTGPAMNYGYSGGSFGRGSGFFNVRPDGSAAIPNPSLRFMTGNVQRMIITNLGNIGINTGFTGGTAPSEKLEVLGKIKLLGPGNGIIFPDATSMTTAGATLGANNFTGNQNVTGTIHATGNISSDTLVSSIGAIDAGTQYRIAGQPVLSNAGDYNLFAGVGAGASNDPNAGATGSRNAFFGNGAGAANTDGFLNSFFGWWAGLANTTSQNNSYFGAEAGLNATGSNNSLFGMNAGYSLTTGINNSFFGTTAGYYATNGTGNSYFGMNSGPGQTAAASGGNNSALGFGAGYALTNGSENTLIGYNAGSTITTGNQNTLVGNETLSSASLTNATAIGHRASVTQNNTLVLGSIIGVNSAAASTKVGIGTTAPYTELHIRKDGAGVVGPVLTLMNGAGGIGAGGAIDFDGYDTAAFDPTVRLQSLDDGASASNFIISTKPPPFPTNTLVERFRITSAGTIGINRPAPDATTKLDVDGRVRVRVLNAGSTAVCFDANNILSSCVSSIRYKDSVAGFTGGLEQVRHLRPVTFLWKTDGKRDLGFVAEEVAKVEPLLSTYDQDGEVQGVKYDRVAALLVNAVKELADDRQRLTHENEDLRARVERLERAIDKLTEH